MTETEGDGGSATELVAAAIARYEAGSPRENRGRLVDLRGCWVCPADVSAVARTGDAPYETLVFVRGVSEPFYSELSRDEVLRLLGEL